MKLEDYGLSRERGFLAATDPATTTLPPLLHQARDMALDLPRILPTGRARTLLQSFVWGEPDAPRALPANLAVPIWQLGQRLGQPPLLPYSSYTLDNWGRYDADGPIDLSNIFTLQHFDGGMDEAWFVLVHVAIEARAGELLEEATRLIAATHDGNEGAAEQSLTTMKAVWDDVNAIFDRMPERCDPYIYFHRVRPWIHGWKDNPALGDGLIYEGVAETEGLPQAFRGQTGSQSSIVPTVDALLSVGHAADPLRTFLDELHIYRPSEHRRFIEEVRAASHVRRQRPRRRHRRHALHEIPEETPRRGRGAPAAGLGNHQSKQIVH